MTLPDSTYQPITSNAGKPQVLRTIIALFDDIIDTELVLMSLRKSEANADEISVILRERLGAEFATQRGGSLLSRVVALSALDAVGGWLQGLASLILPDRASYLAAGPIGVFLATIRESHPLADQERRSHFGASSRQLTRALMAFGFSLDEATYLEQRVVAGSPLIAITTEDIETLRRSLDLFGRYAAVYMGLARTDQEIRTVAARLLVTGPRGGGSVVIADAISPLRRLVQDGPQSGMEFPQFGRDIASTEGDVIGEVTDVLYETPLDAADHDGIADAGEGRIFLARYYIISFGGKLGMGRHRTAIPAELIEADPDPMVVRATRDQVQAAPRFDQENPLSRQDEVTIRRHFKVPNYWITDPRHP